MAQRRNSQNEELLSAHFARRDEPQFALGNAISTYLAIPGLRAFWPMGAHHVTVQTWYADDIACDYDVAAIGYPNLGYSNLYPWACFDGNDYFYYVDDPQFDIRGTAALDLIPELASQGGITLGAWVKFDNSGNQENIISKYFWQNVDRSYRLQKSATDHAEMKTSSDGGNVNIDNVASTVTLAIDTWYLVIGRWNASEISIWVDGIETFTASTQASIFNGAAQLNIGAEASGGGSFFMTGYQSFDFICCMSLSDSIIKNIWQQTRYMFGK